MGVPYKYLGISLPSNIHRWLSVCVFLIRWECWRVSPNLDRSTQRSQSFYVIYVLVTQQKRPSLAVHSVIIFGNALAGLHSLVPLQTVYSVCEWICVWERSKTHNIISFLYVKMCWVNAKCIDYLLMHLCVLSFQ